VDRGGASGKIAASTCLQSERQVAVLRDAAGTIDARYAEDRLLVAAVKDADKMLVGASAAFASGLTSHSVRRAGCSLLYAIGEEPGR